MQYQVVFIVPDGEESERAGPRNDWRSNGKDISKIGKKNIENLIRKNNESHQSTDCGSSKNKLIHIQTHIWGKSYWNCWILKAEENSWRHPKERQQYTADFSPETEQARRQKRGIFKMLKENNCQPRIL